MKQETHGWKIFAGWPKIMNRWFLQVNLDMTALKRGANQFVEPMMKDERLVAVAFRRVWTHLQRFRACSCSAQARSRNTRARSRNMRACSRNA
jgi:hypothetical protein